MLTLNRYLHYGVVVELRLSASWYYNDSLSLPIEQPHPYAAEGVTSSKSSGYLRYNVNSSAPKIAVLMPVAMVRYSGSPRPKLRKAILRTHHVSMRLASRRVQAEYISLHEESVVDLQYYVERFAHGPIKEPEIPAKHVI
jgi:hypothetical protein